MSRKGIVEYCITHNARKATQFESIGNGTEYTYYVSVGGNPEAGQEAFVFRRVFQKNDFIDRMLNELHVYTHDRLRFVATNVTEEPEKDPPPIDSLIFTPRDNEGRKSDLKTLLFFGISRPFMAVRCELRYENKNETVIINQPGNPAFMIIILNYGEYGKLITAKFYNAQDKLVYIYTQ